MKSYTLYGLRKPGEECRYIGITCQMLRARLYHHIKEKGGTHKIRWVRKMIQEDSVKPEIIPYCVGLTFSEACGLERKLISELQILGLRLVNGTSGGEGNFNPTDETRERMSLAKRGSRHHLFGKRHSAKTKQKISVRARGRKISAGTKEKMSVSQTGRKHSEKTLEKCRASRRLYWEKKRQEAVLAVMWR